MTYPYGSDQDAAARAYQAAIDQEPDEPDVDPRTAAWQKLRDAGCPEDTEDAVEGLSDLGVPFIEIERALERKS